MKNQSSVVTQMVWKGDSNGVPAIFFGDGSATTYALNAATGELLWKRRVVEHLFATSTASPQFYKGVLYQGFWSIEEAIAADPSTACCSFRGAVVALDPATGKTIWQRFTIAEPSKATGAGKQQGPSGAGIWSTPTIDEQRGGALRCYRRQLFESGDGDQRRCACLRSEDR